MGREATNKDIITEIRKLPEKMEVVKLLWKGCHPLPAGGAAFSHWKTTEVHIHGFRRRKTEEWA